MVSLTREKDKLMLNAVQSFQSLRFERPVYGVGLMSGTSVDGIDAALVRFTSGRPDGIELIAFHETPFSAETRARIFAAMDPDSSSVEDVCQLHVELGERFAQAALNCIQAAKIEADAVDFIASHGQTVYHIPAPDEARGWRTPSTLQLSSPAVIVERSGITTISDFRQRDMTAGGVGAPLIPFVDAVLFSDPGEDVVCQNIGGISNCTLLKRDKSVIAFDTGPGNMVMDWLMRKHTGEAFDRNGERAAVGTSPAGVVEAAMENPFFRRKPPKATGHEDFGEAFCEWFDRECGSVSLEDKLAAALELTAHSIVEAYSHFLAPQAELKRIIVSGGGEKNPTLMTKLNTLAPQWDWRASADFGVPSQAKEAIGFAILGLATLCGIPANVPSVTGANHSVILGSITPGGKYRTQF